MEPMNFNDFSCLKILEISLPFVFGQEALQFDEGAVYGRIKGSPDPTINDLNSMNKRLIEMIPLGIKELRFAQLGEIWASRFLNTALLECIMRCREKFVKLSRLEFHFYPNQANLLLPELQSSFDKALEFGIEIQAFEGGLLGRDNVEEEWKIGERHYDLVEAKEITIQYT